MKNPEFIFTIALGIFLFLLFVAVLIAIIKICDTQNRRLYNEIQLKDAIEQQNKLISHIDCVHVEMLRQINTLNAGDPAYIPGKPYNHADK